MAITVAGTFGYTTRHWTGHLNTLVIDIRPARLASRPGTQHSSQHLRVRTGQFQRLTARVVIESAHPVVWTVSRTPEGLEATVHFPRLRSPAPVTTPAPAPAPTPVPHAQPGPARQRPEPAPGPSPQRTAPPAARTFAIHAAGTLQAVAQTIGAITGTRIEVDPSVAHRPVALRLPQATLQQALAELARQTSTRWTKLPDGTIRIGP